eukprot:15028116-Alexandrium_andersonii.AAC.1
MLEAIEGGNTSLAWTQWSESQSACNGVSRALLGSLRGVRRRLPKGHHVSRRLPSSTEPPP